MFTVFGFLAKRQDLTLQEFIDYYENKHVPLILSLAPAPLVYKRRYLARTQDLTKSGNPVDFDVIAEFGFADQQAFSSWVEQLFAPGIGEKVAEDEARFLDRSRSRTYVIDEHVTSDAKA